MIKKFSILILCGFMFFCLVACSDNNIVNTNDTPDITYQSETDNTLETKTNTEKTTNNTSSSESTDNKGTISVPDEITNTPSETEVPIAKDYPVFVTENITRITFYTKNGYSTGSDVPSKYMTEIINWLGSFTIDKKAPDYPPPGTNFYYVEIEYSDGTVIKKGLDIIVIEGTAYSTKSAEQPECFMKIISK